MQSAAAPQPLTAALAETLAPIERARTLPGAVFTDAAIHALERERLFGAHWLAVGREEDLAEPGCFVTREVAGERVLAVRAEDGRVRAFFNVCRHRGSRLVEEASGRLRSAISCPYHAWTYALDGSFKRAPHFELYPTMTRELALASMPLEVRHGLVFVALDRGVRDFDACFAGLPDFSRFRLAELRRVKRLDYEIAANWKLVCENYSECYHCPQVHPQLSRLAELSGGGFEEGACFNGGPMQLRAGFETLSTSGRRLAPVLSPTADAGLVHYYLVYPNLMLGIHPEYLITHTVWPLAPDRSHIVCELAYAPEAVHQQGFDAREAIEFWDLTNRQDWALCERVQRGAASRGYLPGPYHPSERCVHAFDRWYAQWLTPLAPGRA